MAITDYRNFGRTGLKVSPLALGCMMFGGPTDQTETDRIIDRALDAGINILDTANVYGAGASEEATGVALTRNGKRDRIILCTKVSHMMRADDPNGYGNSRRHVIEQCEASLRRLKTDYIDLYQIHRPRSDTAIDETLRALDDLVRSGKVRYIGSSNFPAWRLVESLWASRDLGLNRFVSEQAPLNILDRRIERELLPAAQSFDVAVLAWSPIASGMLTGKYKNAADLPDGSRFTRPISVAGLASLSDAARKNAATSSIHPIYASRLTQSAFAAIAELQSLAQGHHIAMADMALAWVLRQRGITSAIIGPRTFDQLESSLSAADVELPDEVLAAIDHIVPSGTHVSPFVIDDMEPGNHRW